MAFSTPQATPHVNPQAEITKGAIHSRVSRGQYHSPSYFTFGGVTPKLRGYPLNSVTDYRKSAIPT